MAALEDARAVDPDNFWAQLKYAELHYRLRVLNMAEEETRNAPRTWRPARFSWRMARKQLQDIRALKQGCVRNVHWTKPLASAGRSCLSLDDGRHLRRDDVEMNWKFFIGHASVAGLACKVGAPIVPVALALAQRPRHWKQCSLTATSATADR